MKRSLLLLFSLLFNCGIANEFQIIYINGPSSCGKSTLIKALQQDLKEPYLHIGVDRMIAMMPEKTNNWNGGAAPLGGFSWLSSKDEYGNPLQELQMGPFAVKMNKTLKEMVLTLARMGHFVIIDDISLSKEEIETWQKTLKDFNTLWIGLKAPLALLEEREKQRGDRIIGSARSQFMKIPKDLPYDIEFDVSQTSLSQMVEKIKSRLYCQ